MTNQMYIQVRAGDHTCIIHIQPELIYITDKSQLSGQAGTLNCKVHNRATSRLTLQQWVRAEVASDTQVRLIRMDQSATRIAPAYSTSQGAE